MTVSGESASTFHRKRGQPSSLYPLAESGFRENSRTRPKPTSRYSARGASVRPSALALEIADAEWCSATANPKKPAKIKGGCRQARLDLDPNGKP